jgi:hypothetical protein
VAHVNLRARPGHFRHWKTLLRALACVVSSRASFHTPGAITAALNSRRCEYPQTPRPNVLVPAPLECPEKPRRPVALVKILGDHRAIGQGYLIVDRDGNPPQRAEAADFIIALEWHDRVDAIGRPL